MKEYELWLDESGEFEDDRKETKKGKNPSLIGGVLFVKREFSENQAGKIIGDNSIHSNREDKDLVFEKFVNITEKEVIFVEISNKECIRVLDSNLTYQNIMAEGLIQIITKLSQMNKNDGFKIDILIAQRGDCTSENKNSRKVSVEQYENRIKERMILEGYEKHISMDCWTIETADAKRDPRLMVADIVCNSFLTRNTKFKGEQGEFISKIRDDDNRTWKFSVFESSLDNTLKRLLLDGRLGEAVVSLCQSSNELFIEEKFNELQEYMSGMSYDEMNLQFKIVSSRITCLVKIGQMYDRALMLLDNLIQHWIPSLKKLKQLWSGELANIIVLDLWIHKYTIFTHQGDLEQTDECEKVCESLILKNGKMSFAALEYLLMYSNRKIIHRINMFDFQSALSESDKLVERCESIKDAINLSEDGILFEELGKALGTRAQIYMYGIRNNQGMFEKAKSDVMAAKAEFDCESDIRRQDMYLVQIYTDAGHFDEALKVLCGDEKELRRWLIEYQPDIYCMCGYIRLMAEGKVAGWEKSDEMYEELNKTQIIWDLRNNKKNCHPKEIIFWKLGTYYANCGKSKKAALDCYKKALTCYEWDSLTIDAIGFSIECERYSFALKEDSSEVKSFLRDFKKHYEKISADNVPESIKMIFKNLDFKSTSWQYFWEMSRNITY